MLLNKWKDGSHGHAKAMVAAFFNAIAFAGALGIAAWLVLPTPHTNGVAAGVHEPGADAVRQLYAEVSKRNEDFLSSPVGIILVFVTAIGIPVLPLVLRWQSRRDSRYIATQEALESHFSGTRATPFGEGGWLVTEISTGKTRAELSERDVSALVGPL